MMMPIRFYKLIACLLAISVGGGTAGAKDLDVLLLSPQVASQNDPGLNMSLVSTYLDTMLEQTPSFAGSSCEWYSETYIDSLSEAYYDTRYRATIAAKIADDYDVVVLVPYFEYIRVAPEFVFEGAWNLGRDILEAGAEPILLMGPCGSNENLSIVGENSYRVANGCGMSVNPAGYALHDHGLFVVSTGDRQAYLVAASLYAQITGLNAADLSYAPVSDSVTLANSATNNYQAHLSQEHYATSRHDSGMVRYRNVDVSAAPFNGTVRYAYVGTSTEIGIKNHLNPIIAANGWTAAPTYVSSSGGGSKYWTDTDFDLAKPSFDANKDKYHFVYARGTLSNGPQMVAYDQSNIVPLTFDRHLDTIGSGAASTQAMLQDIDYGSWYRYYYKRQYGWSSVPFHIAASRFYHSDNSVIVSSDGTHVTTPFYNLIASMMLTSALGQDIEPSTAIQNDAQSLAAFNIGKEVVKQLAFLSEDSRYVPDSQLEILAVKMPVATTSYLYSHTFQATGGTAPYTWESVSGGGLASGLSLSTEGILAGVPSDADESVLVLKITDVNGAIRKRAFRLLVQDHTVPSYTDWADFMFDNSGVSAIGSEEDPDLDGRDNFLEFAFASSPLFGESAPLQILSHNELCFSRGQSGLQYRIEATEDLSDWSAASVIWDSEINVVDLVAVGEEQTVLVETLGADAGFYRVVVEQLP
ncbi:MAG: hypothetical protein ACSHYA_07265 [Opitutaceae bacterium]